MAGTIKGITVEIGGDTTKLGEALTDVNKQSSELSQELSSINKLLKFDPGNADLLAQKQKVLALQIETTSSKLKTLKEAEKQVQEQFERGEVSEEQVRALQREIISTTNKLEHFEKVSEETAKALNNLGDESTDVKKGMKQAEKGSDEVSDALDDMADSADRAEDSAEGLGLTLGDVVKANLLTDAIKGIGEALVNCVEESREYRTNMGKLETAFDTAGHSAETAKRTYLELQGILGESDQAVEASNHLAKLCDNEEDLAKWTTIATGVYAQFGDSLPIENLTEASNETAKTGQLTGGLADALNWAGVNEEKFQERLDACNTEQERQAIIAETLNELYSESAEKYRENNEALILANEANDLLNESMGKIGAIIDPIITDVKMLSANFLSRLVPSITSVTEAFNALTYGDLSASEDLGSAISEMITHLLDEVTDLAPTIATVGISLITTLITSLIDSLPQLVTTGVEVILSLLTGINQSIPLIMLTLVDMIPDLVNALEDGIPQLIQGGVELLSALVDAIPMVIPRLVSSIPRIVTTIIDGLLTAIPQLIQGAVQFLMSIIWAIPTIISTLATQIPKIVTTIIDGLASNIPILLDGALQLFQALIDSIPIIIEELIPLIPWIVDTIITSLLDMFPVFLDASIEFFMALIDATPVIITELARALPQIIEKILTSVKNAIPKLFSTAKQLFGKIIDAVTDLIRKLPANMGKIITSIVSGLKNGLSSIRTIGRDIIQGLWYGIQDMTSWIKDKISGFGASVLNSLKSFFGIHSPSRVFRDEVGRYIAEGIGVGITENADAPLSALKDLGEDMADQDFDINGATINRKLATTYSVNPNGRVFSGDSLLSKLDGIYERLSRLQIVLDTGTLVGETIDKIDAGLASRQLLSARGV